MVSSRILRHGNVISRASNLVRGGFYGPANPPPVWLDVVKRFPPFRKPEYRLKTYAARVSKIVYPEDELRKKFHSTFFFDKDAFNFFGREGRSEKMDVCDRFVKRQMELIEAGDSRAESFAKTEEELLKDGVNLTRTSSKPEIGF